MSLKSCLYSSFFVCRPNCLTRSRYFVIISTIFSAFPPQFLYHLHLRAGGIKFMSTFMGLGIISKMEAQSRSWFKRYSVGFLLGAAGKRGSSITSISINSQNGNCHFFRVEMKKIVTVVLFFCFCIFVFATLLFCYATSFVPSTTSSASSVPFVPFVPSVWIR